MRRPLICTEVPVAMDGAVTPRERLAGLIDRREARIGIVGLGYVGLPLSLTFAEGGFRVLGFDTDAAKVAALGESRSYVGHLDTKRLERAIGSAVFSATADLDRLGEPDAILICVPTPLTDDHQPDLRYVEATVAAIARRLRRGQLVVLESTTYPGTTEELVLPALAAGGLRCGEDFFLAFSPERENPGDADHSTRTIPKVVGGVDPASGDLAAALYGSVVARVVRVSAPRVAEAAKLTENIFRGVNIALVNELKVIYDRMGIDVWEVLDAASTKPFGFMRFTPGPGWGGHCIPVDPFYLSWKARQHGEEARFIELAGVINTEMPVWVMEKLEAALRARGGELRGARVLLLGLAYKPNVDDPRESPAFELLDLLLRAGADPSYHDPHVAVAPAMRSWPDLPALRSVALDATTLRRHDAAIVVTAHDGIDWRLVAEASPLVVDTRGVYREARANVVKA
jgi:UDP-N-acetyl-D-glucosamine dehydrogenase